MNSTKNIAKLLANRINAYYRVKYGLEYGARPIKIRPSVYGTTTQRTMRVP